MKIVIYCCLKIRLETKSTPSTGGTLSMIYALLNGMESWVEPHADQGWAVVHLNFKRWHPGLALGIMRSGAVQKNEASILNIYILKNYSTNSFC